MPATAVGSAKGRSTAASMMRRPGKAVAHQHPGDQQAEHRVDGGGEQRGAEGQAKRGKGARVGGDLIEGRRPDRGRPQHEGGERDQHDQAEGGQREAERQPETGEGARLPQGERRGVVISWSACRSGRRRRRRRSGSSAPWTSRRSPCRCDTSSILGKRARSAGSAADGSTGRKKCLAASFWPSGE